MLGAEPDRLMRSLAESRRILDSTLSVVSTAATDALPDLSRYVQIVRLELCVKMCGECNGAMVAASDNTGAPCPASILHPAARVVFEASEARSVGWRSISRFVGGS